MRKKLEIPESVTTALKAYFDNRDEQRKYSTSDIVRRETILQNLKKMMSPSDDETTMIEDLKVQIETAKVKSAELEKKEPVLVKTFQRELSKWLKGKYLYNHRHHYYIRVRSVDFRSVDHCELFIEGPTVIEERVSDNMTYYQYGEHEFNIIPLWQLSQWSYQTEFEKIMSRMDECELSDITDAVEAKKKEWDAFYDNMKTIIEGFANMDSHESEKK